MPLLAIEAWALKTFRAFCQGTGSLPKKKQKQIKLRPRKKKNLLLFIYGTGVYTRQNQTQGPLWYWGPCTAWQPTWHPAEVQLQPTTLTGTVQSKFYLSHLLRSFCTSAHLTWHRGCRVQTAGNFSKHPTNCSAPQLLKNCWKHRTHDFTMEAHRLSLGVSTRGSEVFANENKTCRALRRPALRGSHDSWHPCSAFRVQHTPVKP